MRPLLWNGNILYASRGYELFQSNMNANSIVWNEVGHYDPAWWRRLSVSTRYASRLFRDGFHALGMLSSGEIIAAVPGAILTLTPGESEFIISHKVIRGTRPLHFAVTPDDRVYWGEYFDNPQCDEACVYASYDRGVSWNVVYEFPKRSIRHVHNVVYDKWENCLWVLTGDNGSECKILRASCDFRTVDVVLSDNQQARAVALVPMEDGLYFSSDTPLELNHVYKMDRKGNLTTVADLSSSSIYGCRVSDAIFFSTMVEPSQVNRTSAVSIYGGRTGGGPDKRAWTILLSWRKDRWPSSFFQYGNAFLPDGESTSGLLALSTIAVETNDLEMSVWRVES
ncbi:MAG TPA: hypothetical protein VFA74_04960 [Terriglobales bacterium]|nr:hypothetical protein [Terriglobales bacterium]